MPSKQRKRVRLPSTAISSTSRCSFFERGADRGETPLPPLFVSLSNECCVCMDIMYCPDARYTRLQHLIEKKKTRRSCACPGETTSGPKQQQSPDSTRNGLHVQCTIVLYICRAPTRIRPGQIQENNQEHQKRPGGGNSAQVPPATVWRVTPRARSGELRAHSGEPERSYHSTAAGTVNLPK